MTFVGRIYLCVAYYFTISVFVAVSFAVNVLCFLLRLLPASGRFKKPLRSTLQTMFRAWAWFMGCIRVLDLRTPALEPRNSGAGEIWVMNHPSLLDASYLMKFIPNGTCIYKRQIGANPLYGSTAKLAEHIPNVGGADLARMACAALSRGENVLIFPEGTRSARIKLDNFKSGFALIAKRSGASVNVLWMESPVDFMTREQPYLKAPRLPAEVEISQIGRIDPADYGSTASIMEAVKRLYERRGGDLGLSKPYPIGVELRAEGDRAEARFVVPVDFPYCEGHFPGNPIVPAVTQIGWALRGIEVWTGQPRKGYRLSRFKFIQPIQPNAKVEIRLERSGERYGIRIWANEELCSSGSVSIAQ